MGYMSLEVAPTAGLAPARPDLKDLSRDDFAFVGIEKWRNAESRVPRLGHETDCQRQPEGCARREAVGESTVPHAALWRHDLVSTESRHAGPVGVP